MGTIQRILLIVAMGGLMEAARSVSVDADQRVRGAAVVLGVGFVIITALFVGKLFSLIKLPKMTGYLITGICAGPSVLGYLDTTVVDGLRLVNGVAVALIALTAGSEMDFRGLRPYIRSIGMIGLIAVLGSAFLLALTTFLLSSFLPFMAGMDVVTSVAIASVIGVVAVAQSPAVVVAIRSETRADGPVARTVLGVVVLADLMVIVLFAIVSSLATALFAGEFDVQATARGLSWELFGSFAAGIVVGALIAIYQRFVEEGLDLFVLVACLVAAEIGQRVHLDPLIIMLAAGMLIENVVRTGEQLRHAFNAASLPVYIVFFTVAGASIRLDAIPRFIVPAVVIVLVRATSLYTGTRIASRLAGAPAAVARWAGFGLLPQSGLAIALALLFARTFPTFGQEAGTLILAVVAINEICTPALLRMAFERCGEGGDRVIDAPVSGSELQLAADH